MDAQLDDPEQHARKKSDESQFIAKQGHGQ
jgi:hypothetical protein